MPGLRREEVAVLAGVSGSYYTRLERGDLHGASDSVLDALALALRLDDAERAHLFDLARSVQPAVAPVRRRPVNQAIRPSVQHILDAMTEAPAFVRNGRLDILAANPLGLALYSEMLSRGGTLPVNSARYIFLDPRARDFYVDWEKAATDSVAVMRSEAGRNPYDRGLSDLVGELSTQSPEFRTRWAAHNVRQHIVGTKHKLGSDTGGDRRRRRHRPDLTRASISGARHERAHGTPPSRTHRDLGQQPVPRRDDVRRVGQP